MRRNKKINKQIYDMIQGDEGQGKKQERRTGAIRLFQFLAGWLGKVSLRR